MTHPKRFHRQTAVVTGAAGSLGRAIAKRLSSEGAFVVVADLDDAGGEETVRQMAASGGDGRFVRADVGREDDVIRLFREVTAGGVPVDVLVNNAGITKFGSLHELPEADWDEVHRVCLKSVYLCSREALPTMMERGGSMVNISSIHQIVSAPGLPAYTAAKGGIVALTRQMAVEYGAYGIRVNTVTPGWIRTPQTVSRIEGWDDERHLLESHPIGRLGEPEDVAEAVAFLASKQAGFITGVELPVDGGSSLIQTMQWVRPGPRRRRGLPRLTWAD